MANRLVNDNGIFLGGLVNDITGEHEQYKKVTKWADGSTMGDGKCDGFLYRKVGNEYFRRVGGSRINVLNLGLKNDGITRNELILAEKMQKLPVFTEFYFPAGTYVFGPLPEDYNNFSNIPVAIDWGASGANFTGEGESTIFKILPGCVGMQITGGIGRGIPVLKNFLIQGSGQDSAIDGHVTNNGPTIDNGANPNPDFNRPLGEWSLHPNNYQYSGINAWAQCILDGLTVKGCAGHGVWTQGYAGLKPKGHVKKLSGTFINYHQFRLDDPSLSSFFRVGTKVELGDAKGFIGGIEPNGDLGIDVSLDGNIRFPDSGHYIIDAYEYGNYLIADNGVIQGNCLFEFNGGCGFYIQGSDGNQWNMFGGTVRENGIWGIIDSSFLGFFAYGVHATHNGNHINKYAVDGIPFNDIITVGAYKTTDVNARSGWFNCYSEQDQAPSIFPYRTTVIGGCHAAGVIGGCYHQEGVDANILKIGNIIISRDTDDITFRFGSIDTLPLRFRRTGPGNGTWSFGITNSDQTEFSDVFSIALSGATIKNSEGQTRTTNSKSVGPAFYTNYLGLNKTQSAISLLAYLNRLDPINDLKGDYLIVEKGSGTGDNGPLRYKCVVGGSSPQYMPDDFGRGTLNSRPSNLLVMDAGWRYFITDNTPKWTTWTGTSWIDG